MLNEMTAKGAFMIVRDALRGKYDAAEAVIAGDPEWAYTYAKVAIEGRFPAGEAAIAADPKWSYYYARDVIKGRFPAGEAAIAARAEWAHPYAKQIIKGPWPAGEATINADKKWAAWHTEFVKKPAKPAWRKKWPALDAAIEGHEPFEVAVTVGGVRWPSRVVDYALTNGSALALRTSKSVAAYDWDAIEGIEIFYL